MVVTVNRAMFGCRVVASTFAASVGASAFGAMNCGDGTHAYLARKYDDARDCLEPVRSVDVLAGEGSSSGCDAKCFATTTSSGAPAGVYVSSECPPYPPRASIDVSEALCARALAAERRGDFCRSDGGSTRPTSDAANASDAGAPD
jgi:hypothetical protein